MSKLMSRILKGVLVAVVALAFTNLMVSSAFAVKWYQVPGILTYPNGGEYFKGGQSVRVTWNTSLGITDYILIMISTDGGANWTQSKAGGFRDIVFKPGDPNTVYAAADANFFGFRMPATVAASSAMDAVLYIRLASRHASALPGIVAASNALSAIRCSWVL